jgi:hypothetical protein
MDIDDVWQRMCAVLVGGGLMLIVAGFGLGHSFLVPGGIAFLLGMNVFIIGGQAMSDSVAGCLIAGAMTVLELCIGGTYLVYWIAGWPMQ